MTILFYFCEISETWSTITTTPLHRLENKVQLVCVLHTTSWTHEVELYSSVQCTKHETSQSCDDRYYEALTAEQPHRHEGVKVRSMLLALLIKHILLQRFFGKAKIQFYGFNSKVMFKTCSSVMAVMLFHAAMQFFLLYIPRLSQMMLKLKNHKVAAKVWSQSTCDHTDIQLKKSGGCFTLVEVKLASDSSKCSGHRDISSCSLKNLRWR